MNLAEKMTIKSVVDLMSLFLLHFIRFLSDLKAQVMIWFAPSGLMSQQVWCLRKVVSLH